MFSTCLHQIRTSVLKLSANELAEVLGVHRTTIQRWEAGKMPIPTATQIAIEALASRADERAA